MTYLDMLVGLLYTLIEILIVDLMLKFLFDCRLIAVTGGIGSGKSTFCNMLRYQSKGTIQILSLDEISRKLQEKGSVVYQLIKLTFSQDLDYILQYSNINGIKKEVGLNRANFRNHIMNDKTKYAQLNSIMMPFITIKALFELYGGFIKNRSPIVMEIPLLLEKGLGWLFMQNILINVVEKTQIKRVKINRGLNEADVLKIMETQISNELKKKYCCKIIENESNKESLEIETSEYLKELSMASLKERILFFNLCSLLLSTVIILSKNVVFYYLTLNN